MGSPSPTPPRDRGLQARETAELSLVPQGLVQCLSHSEVQECLLNE